MDIKELKHRITPRYLVLSVVDGLMIVLGILGWQAPEVLALAGTEVQRLVVTYWLWLLIGGIVIGVYNALTLVWPMIMDEGKEI